MRQIRIPLRLMMIVAILCVLGRPVSGSDDADFAFFESKVRPILAENCHDCHGPDSGKGKARLRVDSRDALLRGGDSGPAIVPGEPGRSLLILAVRHDGAVEMPPKSKLPQSEINTLAAWVKMGAPWPGTPAAAKNTENVKAEAAASWSRAARDFWAFQMPKVSSLPAISDPAWATSPIDRFVRARLDAAGLSPAPPADKRTLIRRVTFDLTGLPPALEEIEAFLRDDSAVAYEKVVDRLLASPHYGERWGRHWLDVARYADSNGMDDNLAYADAWRYRNYVIASFNADNPFDRFLAEQLAGDILAAREPARRDELQVATGFLALGPKMLAEDDPVKQQMDIVDEQLDTTGRVFLGLTIGCARCHDHKFDPIAMSDYYAMAGIFKSTRTMISHRVDSKWNATGLGSLQAILRLEDLERIIDRHDNALVNGATNAMSAEERGAHTKLLEDAKAEYASIPKAMSVAEGAVGDQHVLLRGNHLTRGPLVPRGFPKILSMGDQAPLSPTHSGRLELANWLASPTNPLTARVIANRVWRWHFGKGLVRSVDNFGKLGQLPSHPELLDWLAIRLVEGGWSLKSLHRRIVTSQTYRMGTKWDERSAMADPEDLLFWKFPRRRLEAEEARDALLAVSGGLDRSAGGIVLPSTPFLNLALGNAATRPSLYETRRRSVYLPVLRSALHDQFQAFDFPDPAVSNGDRGSTTVASQALFMMNGTVMKGASERIARDLLNEPGLSDQERLSLASRRIFGRSAEPEESREWAAFLERYQSLAARAGTSPQAAREVAWRGLCRALMSSNEFLYVY